MVVFLPLSMCVFCVISLCGPCTRNSHGCTAPSKAAKGWVGWGDFSRDLVQTQEPVNFLSVLSVKDVFKGRGRAILSSTPELWFNLNKWSAGTFYEHLNRVCTCMLNALHTSTSSPEPSCQQRVETPGLRQEDSGPGTHVHWTSTCLLSKSRQFPLQCWKRILLRRLEQGFV